MPVYEDKPETYLDNNGWTQKAPISDEKCILMCLKNCRKLDGMNRKQVERLILEWKVISDNTPAPQLPEDSVAYDGHN
tara:strand:- start:434 stop:667 length:234 start_codon:yes stop_codon:yes gene_type:complete